VGCGAPGTASLAERREAAARDAAEVERLDADDRRKPAA